MSERCPEGDLGRPEVDMRTGTIVGSAIHAGLMQDQPDGGRYFVLRGAIEPVDLLGVTSGRQPIERGRRDRLNGEVVDQDGQ